MVRYLQLMPFVLEVILFSITLLICTFLSENGFWVAFFIAAALCIALFALLEFCKSEPIRARLDAMLDKHAHLATQFRDMGIDGLFNMQAPHEQDARNEVNRRIIDEGSHFSLLAETGSSYVLPEVRRQWDTLKKKLERRCVLRILIVDPFCKAKLVRNSRNGVSRELDPKLRLDRLFELESTYPHVELKFTTEPYCSLFFSEKEMIYDPYHLGRIADRIENRFIAMTFLDSINGEHNAIFSVLRDHFEYLWESSIDCEAFKLKYRTQLKRAKLNV